MRFFQLGLIFFLLHTTGCAFLHKVQISEIDNRQGYSLVPFEIKVSETGIDLKEVTAIQRTLFKDSRAGKDIGNLAAVISLFQLGPRTGNAVYVENYAVDLVSALHAQCPNGAVTGLTSIRESRKYPVVSGEIVKVTGYCLRKRAPASVDSEPILSEEI